MLDSMVNAGNIALSYSMAASGESSATPSISSIHARRLGWTLEGSTGTAATNKVRLQYSIDNVTFHNTTSTITGASTVNLGGGRVVTNFEISVPWIRFIVDTAQAGIVVILYVHFSR